MALVLTYPNLFLVRETTMRRNLMQVRGGLGTVEETQALIEPFLVGAPYDRVDISTRLGEGGDGIYVSMWLTIPALAWVGSTVVKPWVEAAAKKFGEAFVDMVLKKYHREPDEKPRDIKLHIHNCAPCGYESDLIVSDQDFSISAEVTFSSDEISDPEQLKAKVGAACQMVEEANTRMWEAVTRRNLPPGVKLQGIDYAPNSRNEFRHLYAFDKENYNYQKWEADLPNSGPLVWRQTLGDYVQGVLVFSKTTHSQFFCIFGGVLFPDGKLVIAKPHEAERIDDDVAPSIGLTIHQLMLGHGALLDEGWREVRPSDLPREDVKALIDMHSHHVMRTERVTIWVFEKDAIEWMFSILEQCPGVTCYPELRAFEFTKPPRV